MRARAAAVAATAAIAACNSPRLKKFFPPGAPFVRTFGQLYLDGTTPRVSHYAVLDVSLAPDLRAVSTGTVEYVRNFDGMGNCLLLRTKKYFSTPNHFDALQALPKPGAVVFGYCNLDEAQVQTAAQATYATRLSDPASAAAAAVHFIAHDDGFTTLDVTADDADPTQSTALGRANGGQLYVAAFVQPEGGGRRYVNAMPYLAAAIEPATDLDSVAPVVSDVVLQTSADGTFGADLQSYTPAGDVVAGTVPRTHLRVAVRSTETTRAGGASVVPYQIGYELSAVTLSGSTVAARNTIVRGVALLNTVDFAQTGALATARYSATAPAVSDPATGAYYMLVPWPAAPAPSTEAIVVDAFDATASASLDLTLNGADGTPLFASGDYELHLSIADAVNRPPAERTLRFTLAPGGAAPGDSEVSYAPSSGPLGTSVVVTTVVPGAFVDGSATISFTGTFTPAGPSFTGDSLGTTTSFTVDYPADKVTVIDGTHLSIHIGAVAPPAAILTSPPMRSGLGGRLAGSLHVLGGGGYDHTVASFAFTVTAAGRFGQVQAGTFTELPTLPLMHATTAADVAAAPDYQRVVIELRIPDAPASPPGTVDVRVHALDAGGGAIETRTHTLGLVGLDGTSAIYRSGEGGTRKLVFVDNAALAGEQGADLLAIALVSGGGAFIDGTPP